jgi:hypothetical protein
MEWVKKNMVFVIALAVAVLLMGGGVWYLLGTKGDADAVDSELQAKNQELDGIIQRPVYPDAANVKLAKEEEARVADFIKQARSHFTELQKPEGLDTAGFKSHLEATITELLRDAERAGVKLPDQAGKTGYGFTFDDPRKQLQLPANSLAPLAIQLGDLKMLCQVLFDAKIPSLVSLKRAQVLTNETTSNPNICSKKIETNSALGSVRYPYEIVFQGFSPELASVLNGLIRSTNAFIVKSLNVERGNLESAAPAQPSTPMVGTGNPYGMDPNLMRRYGMMPGGAAQAAQTQAQAAGRPGEVVVEEKPLKVTMGIELIKLLPPEAAAKPAKAASAAAAN